MDRTLTQEDIDIYASDSSAVVEKPATRQFNTGVDVNYTAPAKWWNWLWKSITTAFQAIKADKSSMYDEMENVLTDASITASASDTHQLSNAVNKVSYDSVKAYDEETVTEQTLDTEVTHVKNKPYVVGHTLFIPDSELL